MINSNQLLLILVTLICIPTFIMSASSSLDIATDDHVKVKSSLEIEPTISELNSAFGLTIGDSYYDLRIKLPQFEVETEINTFVIIKSGNFTFELDEKANRDTDKYHISNDAKITKISRID